RRPFAGPRRIQPSRRPSPLAASYGRDRVPLPAGLGDARAPAGGHGWVTEIETPAGPALGDVSMPPGELHRLLVLGHGAGGGVDAPDLVAVSQAVRARGVAVALVTQPYRVAGRRAPAPATQLDEAWTAVVRAVRKRKLARVPLVVGGRSAGARVACRTAVAVGASGIVALAF